MIQLADLKQLDEKNIYKLYDLVKPELDKKAKLYQRYARKTKDTQIFGIDENNKEVAVPFEKYITGFFSIFFLTTLIIHCNAPGSKIER